METFVNKHLMESLTPIIDKLGWLSRTTEISEDDLDTLHSAIEDLKDITGEYIPTDRQREAHLIDQAMEARDPNYS